MITVIMVIIRKLFDFYRHSSRVRGHIIVLGNDENFSQWFCAVFYFFLPLTFHKNKFQCKFSTRSRFHIPRIHRYTPKSAYTQKKASAEVNLLQTVHLFSVSAGCGRVLIFRYSRNFRGNVAVSFLTIAFDRLTGRS